MPNTLEEWRPIAGLENLYEISNVGQVRSLTRTEVHTRKGKQVTYKRVGRVLKPVLSSRGYLMVSVGCGLDKTMKTVHSLVAHAFLPTCPGRYGVGSWNVDHINDDKLDNRAENLQWLPHWDNCFVKAGGSERVKAQVIKQVRDANGRYR
jgi:hypothetical protein